MVLRGTLPVSGPCSASSVKQKFLFAAALTISYPMINGASSKVMSLGCFSFIKKKRTVLLFRHPVLFFKSTWEEKSSKILWKHCPCALHKYHYRKVNTVPNPKVSHSFKTFHVYGGMSWTEMMLFTFCCQWELMDGTTWPSYSKSQQWWKLFSCLHPLLGFFAVCVQQQIIQQENLSSTFWFPQPLRNSAITPCRLHLHLPGTRPSPFHRRKEEWWKSFCWCLRFPAFSTGFSSLPWTISGRKSHEYLILCVIWDISPIFWDFTRSTKHEALNDWNDLRAALNYSIISHTKPEVSCKGGIQTGTPVEGIQLDNWEYPSTTLFSSLHYLIETARL